MNTQGNLPNPEHTLDMEEGEFDDSDPLRTGDAVLVRFPSGDVRPALCVSAFSDDMGNFQVFLDGINDRKMLRRMSDDGHTQFSKERVDEITRRGLAWITSIHHRDHEHAGDLYWLSYYEHADDEE